jgi:hypothetical protein
VLLNQSGHQGLFPDSQVVAMKRWPSFAVTAGSLLDVRMMPCRSTEREAGLRERIELGMRR